MSTLIHIPEEKRQVWGMFSASVIDKPEQFDKSFEILLRHSNRALMGVIVGNTAEDLVWTLICYLPVKAQKATIKYMKNNPDVRSRVLDEVRRNQEVVRLIVKKGIAQKDARFVGLKVVA